MGAIKPHHPPPSRDASQQPSVFFEERQMRGCLASLILGRFERHPVKYSSFSFRRLSAFLFQKIKKRKARRVKSICFSRFLLLMYRFSIIIRLQSFFYRELLFYICPSIIDDGAIYC